MSELQQIIDYVPSANGDGGFEPSPRIVEEAIGPNEVTYEALEERLKEANDTYQVLTGPSGRRYEAIVFNSGQLATASIAKPSTSFSSGYKNPANILEVALDATAKPGAAFIYMGSFGNHPTGHMDSEDLRYVARTGRYTTGDGIIRPFRPLPSVQDMAAAFMSHDLVPTHFTADVEAGRLALGLMSAFDKDSIRWAMLNGLDGISATAHPEVARAAEDLRSRVRRRGVKDGDPGELTPANIKDVKDKIPRVFSGLGRIAHLAPLPVVLYPRDVYSALRLNQGFRKNNDLHLPQSHAVLQDTLAALTRQDAMIRLLFRTGSRIHNERECIRFGQAVMNSLGKALLKGNDHRRVQLVFAKGTLDQHTDDPIGRTQLERSAFPDILNLMSISGLREALRFENDEDAYIAVTA